jgi:hypothetical protein
VVVQVSLKQLRMLAIGLGRRSRSHSAPPGRPDSYEL